MILAFSFLKLSQVITGLIISLVIILFAIGYRYYIRRVSSQQRVAPEKFATLHGLEFHPAKGTLELYFTILAAKKVAIELLDENWQLVFIIKEADYEAGGHIVRFDTETVADGYYYYQLRTDNQKTSKKMLINNSLRG
jgi:flagellar hook assembly protein FlgD